MMPKITSEELVSDIVGLPAFLNKEGVAGYLELWSRVRAEIKPATIFDELDAHAYAESFAEIRRLKELQRSLIDSATDRSFRDLQLGGAGTFTTPNVQANAFSLREKPMRLSDSMIRDRERNMRRIAKAARKALAKRKTKGQSVKVPKPVVESVPDAIGGKSDK